MVGVRDRARDTVTEERQFGSAALRLLYDSRWGGPLRALAVRPLVSELAALPRRGSRSARDIAPFCADYGVAVDDFVRPPGGWASFADFFVRDWVAGARPLPDDPDVLLSPADAKLLVVPLGADPGLVVKEVAYRLEDLLGDAALAARFAGGWAFVLRLTVDDAHRYVHAASGTCRGHRRLGGVLHTVGPRAGRRPVLAQNRREYAVVDTDRFGTLVQAEIGAILVGRIRNHACRGDVRRGSEKGRFELGGSTVVLLCEAGRVIPDADLVAWSSRGVETRVRAREPIGRVP